MGDAFSVPFILSWYELKNETWACDHLKTRLETCQRITSKRYSSSMGRHLSPRFGQVILVSGYSTAVNWSQHWCTICVQYQSSCATKLARKCEIEHWFSCGADGRAGCGRCTVTWLPNFLGWVDLLTHGAPQARFARQRSAIIIIIITIVIIIIAFEVLERNP